EHPSRPDTDAIVVPRAAHDGGVAAPGQGDGPALLRLSYRAGADQLVPLLAPHTCTAGEHPSRAGGIVAATAHRARIVAWPAHDGGVATPGQRDGPALPGLSYRAGADQLAPLLAPHTCTAGEHPSRAGGIEAARAHRARVVA